MNSNHVRKRNKSEIIFTEFINKEIKDVLFESFSDVKPLKTENNFTNTEENSINDGILKIGKSNKQNFIKIISSKFHDLYLKLINQIKSLKQENKRLNSALKSNGILEGMSNINNADMEEQEIENDTLKLLMKEEMECFNQILLDFNIQFNDLVSQEEYFRNDISKKQKEIDKLNMELTDYRRQKEEFVNELQNIALKLSEYKISLPLEFDNKYEQDINNSFGKQNQNITCIEKDDDQLSQSKHTIEYKENESIDVDMEDYNLFVNSNNKDYILKKLIQENKKYISLIKTMKEEESQVNNLISQVEIDLENFNKFKNFMISKISVIEENMGKCREMIDSMISKFNNIEFYLEINEENNI